jgi:hypothetical protein
VVVLGGAGAGSRNLCFIGTRRWITCCWRRFHGVRHTLHDHFRGERCKLRWRAFGLNVEANVGRVTRAIAMRKRAKLKRIWR